MEPVAFAALVTLDPSQPRTAAIYRALRDAARDGRLPPGARLPSTRAGAQVLGVFRNTLSAAYDLLRADGVVAMRAGAAPTVRDIGARAASTPAPGSEAALSARGAALASAFPTSISGAPGGRFIPGVPDEALIPATSGPAPCAAPPAPPSARQWPATTPTASPACAPPSRTSSPPSAASSFRPSG